MRSRLLRALALAYRVATSWGPLRPLYIFTAVLAVSAGAVAFASERGDRETALKLLAKGADVNAPGPDGTTAIMYAAANDDIELVRALIKAGANVKTANQFGTSAVTEAAIIGSAPIVDALLKAG